MEWRAGETLQRPTAQKGKGLQVSGGSKPRTQPIKARIDMLSTGIRTPIGVKVIGTDLVEIDRLPKQVEQVLRTVPGTSSAYAERGIGGYYLDIVPDRAALARDGLVPMPAGGAVPLGEVAKVAPARGPTSIRTENGQLAVYVYVDIRDRDIGGYVVGAKPAVNAS